MSMWYVVQFLWYYFLNVMYTINYVNIQIVNNNGYVKWSISNLYIGELFLILF